tara:strand:- start:662 stop:838 length:177 start_codon:yes stop_codon:yes gene_type:complete
MEPREPLPLSAILIDSLGGHFLLIWGIIIARLADFPEMNTGKSLIKNCLTDHIIYNNK